MQIIRFRWELSDSGHFVRFLRLRICVEGKTVGGIPFKAGIRQATWTANTVFTKPIALIARIDRGQEE
jgi:hypothetical protein